MKLSIFRQLFTLLIVATTLPVQAQQDGRASYYHNSLHGRTMSNGQPYDRNRLTCAHRTLPFGTKLRVTNQANGKQVIVEVTDRGPFVRGRVIDLSYAAAREIGMIAAGVGSIRIEVLPRDVTVPYLNDNSYGMPEIEYGMAGVCYEFIPEWKEEEPKLQQEVEKPEREVEEEAKRITATTKQQPATTKSQIQNHKEHKVAKTTAAAKKESNDKITDKKKEGSRGWTDFFDKLKDWGR